MKVMKKIIIMICIIILIVLIVLISFLKGYSFKKEEYDEFVEYNPQTKLYGEEYEDLNDYNDYFMLKDIMDKYLENIEIINSEFKNNSNTIKLKAINYINDILDEKYKEKTNITQNKIVSIVSKYKEKNNTYILILNSILAKRLNDDEVIYLIDFDINDVNDNIMVKTDSQNYTFSIFLYDYTDNNNFKINNKNISISEGEIQENENNIMTHRITTHEDIAKEYFELIKNTIVNNPEKLYEHLDAQYRQSQFLKYEDFEKFINNLKIQNQALEKYSIKAEGNKNTYTLVDTNSNKYVLYAPTMLNYELVIQVGN